ncbi:MAG TPA: phosphate acetyltransferase [Actinomycetota bacterium]|jgi:phosphate acetyltransferase
MAASGATPTRNVYLAALEPGSGKSVVALGLMEALSRRLGPVGYFRPVVESDAVPDADVELLRQRYRLPQSYADSYAVTIDDLRAMSDRGRFELLLKRILEAFKRLDQASEVVLVEGGDFTGASRALEFDFNAELANQLGCLVLLVVRGSRRSADEVLDAARLAHGSLTGRGCTILATICNRVAPALLEEVRGRLPEVVGEEPAFAMPEVPALDAPTVTEVAEALSARFLRPADGAAAPSARREVRNVVVGAMSLPNFLGHLVGGEMVITPGDRADLIVGALASRVSGTYPDIAGLLLTGGLVPEPAILRLVDGLAAASVPVLAVDTDTYATAAAVGGVRGALRPDSDAKIATALASFEEHVDTAVLERGLQVTPSTRMTPLQFEQELIDRAKADRRHVVLPEGNDDRILQAAEQLLRRGVVDLTILGGEEQVRARAAALGLDLGGARLVDPATSPWREEFAQTYYQLRKHKGVALTLARDSMVDVAYFGTMMVHAGLADGMVSGAAHTTAHTIRPAFEVIRTAPGTSIVSSVFFMCLADRVLVYGDCAVVPNPDAEQLADIAVSAAGTAAMFGIEPRIAMLSYSTGESGAGEDVDKVRKATTIARGQRPDLPIEGPIQYDAAIDPEVARTKLPGSPVAGRATVFVFPDLNTGNNTYKAVQRSARAVAIGPVLQGLRRPVNDLSRGALVADIVNTVAITAIQAQAEPSGAAG